MKAPNPYIRQGGSEEKSAQSKKRVFNVRSEDLNLILSCCCVVVAAPLLAALITGESLGSLFLGAFGLFPTPPAPMAETVIEAVRPVPEPGDHGLPALELEAPSSEGLTGTMETSSALAPIEVPRELLRQSRQAAAAAAAAAQAQASLGGEGGQLASMGGLGSASGGGAYGLGAEGPGGPAGRGAAGGPGAAGRLGALPGQTGGAQGLSAGGAASGQGEQEERKAKPMLQMLKTSGSEAIQKLKEAFNPRKEKELAKAAPEKGGAPLSKDGSGLNTSSAHGRAAAEAMAAAAEVASAAQRMHDMSMAINTDFKGPWQKDPTLSYMHSALSQIKGSGLAAAAEMKNYATLLQMQAQELQNHSIALSAFSAFPVGQPGAAPSFQTPPPPDISGHMASIKEAQDDLRALRDLLRQQAQAAGRHQKPRTPDMIKRKGGEAAFD